MLEHLRAQLAELLDQRAEQVATIEEIAAESEARSGGAMTEDEQKRFNAARSAVGRLDKNATEVRGQIAELEELAEARSRAERIAGPSGSAGVTVRVGHEPGVYRPDGGPSFFIDLMNSHSDPSAVQRLARHQQVESRTTTSGNVAGLVPPAYLTDELADLPRSAAPFVHACRQINLPPAGMVLTIPRITGGTSVLAQTSETTTLANSDVVDTPLDVPVRTIAGYIDVSRQAVDRGIGVDQTIYQDLVAAYYENVEVQALQGDGSNGTHFSVAATTGVLTVTMSTTSVSSFVSKIAEAKVAVVGSRKRSPEVIVMHPRRWAWLTAATDSSGRPLVLPIAGSGAAVNAMGTSIEGSSEGHVGYLSGLPVIVSPGISTARTGTTDEVLVTRLSDMVFAQEAGAPFTVEADQVLRHRLVTRFVVHGYSAFSAGRWPGSTAILTGTGLTNPTF